MIYRWRLLRIEKLLRRAQRNLRGYHVVNGAGVMDRVEKQLRAAQNEVADVLKVLE